MIEIKGLEFFQPTPELRELILLNDIARESKVSQLRLSGNAGIRASMVNGYLKMFERKGLMTKAGENRRRMTYHLTPEGLHRRQTLFRYYMNEIVGLYKRAKEEFVDQMAQVKEMGIDRVVLYGASDTGEIVSVICERVGLHILGIVDSDATKHGKLFCGRLIQDPSWIVPLAPQAVVVTSLGHAREIAESISHVESQGIKVICLRF